MIKINSQQPIEINSDWYDWKWQQKNAIRDEITMKEACGDIPYEIYSHIQKNLDKRKMQITPYYMRLIKDNNHTGDITESPLWRQVIPFWSEEISGSYDGETENWELNHEMKTPICQHKYDNRVILRMANTCNAYCQFCFEALRTLETDGGKAGASRNAFNDSIEYIKNNPSIEEVILSGGDPLVLSDKKLEEQLSAIREIGDHLLIRLHTRALTFNPYRITDELISMLKKYRVNAVGVHVCHPSELSQDFKTAVRKIQTVVPIVFSNMPLLKGINDNANVLHTLFIELYRMGVKPYYLYHFMPFSPGASEYKASIADVIEIMNKLKRKVSNIAMPEYVLPHAQGKFTVPLITDSNDYPSFKDVDGSRNYCFKNWQGDWCNWNDD